MRLKIAILAGDGIGPEVTNEAVNILRAVAEFGGHDFTFVPLLSAESPSPPPARRCPPRRSTPASNPMPFCSARSATTNSTRSRPDKRPEAGLLQIRQALGGFANLRPSIAYPALAANSPLRPEVTEGADILFVRELLGGLYFGPPREWNKATGEAWNTMRYTRPRSPASPGSPSSSPQSAERRSPPSTRPTSSKSPSSGAPPSPKSPRTTPPSLSSTSSSTPWPCTS